ncbi:CocE/NonD family hydrolase [Pseudoalteromonas aurantia]|uniref:Peptidase S15 n=1 Tax=Pseudoalteromonas aurantia TaxID=43654 RepID=A0A5S3UZZ7_9GAMM|nr:CocE/NonD family hydrolase [Pseudoalteromonas aurantia]TMO61815.1 peptidase S15 [Pseudoalteromonas aurantia]TMO63772.1 peptidase S15 [Pseudoalteromonas aurantia]TMO69602.1 peptidase S15 [Pseudoalteromonas aurantia]
MILKKLIYLSLYCFMAIFTQTIYGTALLQSNKVTHSKDFVINTDVLIKTSSGTTLSAVIVLPKTMKKPQPTALQFHIYTDVKEHVKTAINAAKHGYIGIVVDTRGKRLSPDQIIPYEHDAKDINDVIDWISKQDFSDGRVAMYGGSYLGFTQWAATKYMHPALKTIVPSVANNPMQGLPMENNIFITPNYQWPFYVMNNKTLDKKVNNNRDYWNKAINDWYLSGRSYRDIDKIEGTPNPLLQKFLNHPSHDDFWLNMGPRGNEYSKINIPILSINGYYDDGHISALYYLNQHLKHNKNAEHYWIIGPYNHFFSKSKTINGYLKDSVAELDRTELAFQWFDYVLKGKKKPDLLKSKVNYQLMGDNSWQHANSLTELNSDYQRFYLSTEKYKGTYLLTKKISSKVDSLKQVVDLADRTTSTNTESYYWPIIKDRLIDPTGFTFASLPFAQDTSVHGSFSGEIKVKINKKDFDLGMTFYELTPDGKYFELFYYIGRASYAKDPSNRQLLTPHKVETIPFKDTRMTGKLFKKGSRLVVALNVNKNEMAQINFGTGKDVSDESNADGAIPLKVEWLNSSFINIPMKVMNRKKNESEYN